MLEFRCDTCGETALSLSDLRHHGELRHPMKAPHGPTGRALPSPIPSTAHVRAGIAA